MTDLQKTEKHTIPVPLDTGKICAFFIRIGFIALILRLTYGVFVTEVGFALSGAGFVPLVLKGINLLQNIAIVLAVPFCIIKNPKRCIVFTAAVALVLLASILIFPETLTLFLHEAKSMLKGLYLPAVICMSVSTDKALWKDLKLCGYITAGMALIVTVVYVLGRNSLYGISDYDMSYSYAVITPALILLAAFFAEGRIFNLLISFALVAAIVKYGARGPVMCYCVAAALMLITYLVLKLKKHDISTEVRAKHNFAIVVCFALIAASVVIAGFVIIKEQKIQTGIRSIDAFNSTQADSGRSQYHYMPAIAHIFDDSIFAGDGLFSDRPYLFNYIKHVAPIRITSPEAMYGCYCHNIILELMFEFGLMGGAILFMCLMWMFIRSFRRSGEGVWGLCVFAGLASALLVSGSYLTFSGFWILMGLCISILSKGGIKE